MSGDRRELQICSLSKHDAGASGPVLRGAPIVGPEVIAELHAQADTVGGPVMETGADIEGRESAFAIADPEPRIATRHKRREPGVLHASEMHRRIRRSGDQPVEETNLPADADVIGGDHLGAAADMKGIGGAAEETRVAREPAFGIAECLRVGLLGENCDE
jgi:hypothetical protein